MGEHHGQLGLYPQRAQALCQPANVTLDHGLDVGIYAGGRGTLELPDLGGHTVADADSELGKQACRHLRDACLVGRVCVTVQKTDCQRLDAGLFYQVRQGFGDRLVAQGPEYLAREGDAFVDLAPPAPRNQWRRHSHAKIVDVVAYLPAGLQDITEPPGRDQAGPGSLTLEYGIGCHGGGVNHIRHRLRRELGPTQNLPCPCERALGRVPGCAQNLGKPDRPVLLIDQSYIGEGSTNVDG